MVVAVQVSVLGSYRPPVAVTSNPSRAPPQTIILLPLQTAVWRARPPGALAVLVGAQVSVLGLYLPPVFAICMKALPPQTIISVPLQTAVCNARPSGALVIVVATQLSLAGLYLPPVFRGIPEPKG